ncbi:hypothetical protein [Streptomyces sp. NPDC054865]
MRAICDGRVTVTHTAGVLILGLALPAGTHLAGESVLTWLGTASGLIVTAIGLRLLATALPGTPVHAHHHGPGRHHEHHHDHTSDQHPHTHQGHDAHTRTHPRRSLEELLPQ